MCRSSAARTFALGIGTIALVVASVAGAAVYKCKSASGAVTYQDFPCDGGAIVDIRPGAPDPTAIERLDRANAEFDRRAAARNADETNAAFRREELDLRRRELEIAQGGAGSTGAAPFVGYVPAYDYLGYGYGVYGYGGYGSSGHGLARPSGKHHANRPGPPKAPRGAQRVPPGRVPADLRRVQPR